MKNFSLWCDFIENSFLDNEFIKLLYNNKINGATSNPAIFKEAILKNKIYKDKINNFKSKNTKEKYENLAIQDIQKAADKLALNYQNKNDGFVSIEIDPFLHDNTILSLGEAKRLYSTIARKNIMIKIPATKQSYEVMSVLMSEGINVNATLIFSLEQTKACFEALNQGLKEFRKKNISSKIEPQAVISVFVSRFDRLLNNKILDKNTIGITNATLSYHYINSKNEKNIRTLFASTGVKGDDLAKDYYIKELLYKNCINTAPLDAIRAFNNDNIIFKDPLDENHLNQILERNLSKDELNNTCKFLLDDGLKSFCIAFEEILKAL